MKLSEILSETVDVGSNVTSNKQLGNFPKGTKFVVKRVNDKTFRVSPVSKPEFSFVADKTSFGGNVTEAGDLVTPLNPGDTVYVRWNNYATKTGVVKRIGRTMIHVTLKNGETIAFPPKDVSQDFEELNPNPYREKQGSLSEMTMRVDSFAEFRVRCEHLGYVIKIEDGVAVAYDEHGNVVGKFTQDGRHGHGQLVIEHQPTTLINFLSRA